MSAIIYHGARIHTLDPDRPAATGLRIEDGRVTDLFDGAPPAGITGRRIDLGGAIVLPGLVDAHIHLQGLGQIDRELDLRATASKEAIQEQVRSAASSTRPGQWIRGRGWDQNDWRETAFPSRTDLDSVTADHPVWLTRIDGHGVWLNSNALALAGIDGTTADPPGGQILRDADGLPTGVLIDNAIDLARRALPPPSAAEIRADLLAGMERCNGVGLTAIHDMGTSPAALQALRGLEDEGLLSLRVYAYLGGDRRELAPLLEAGPDRDGLVQVVGVKLFSDGALGSRGAALLEPYSDDPDNLGLLLSDAGELEMRAREIHRAGLQVAIHAIGDRGNRLSLDAIEAAQGDTRDRHHRIEHAQILDAEDVARFARGGIVASMQPTHATSDMPWAGARLGDARIRYAYAWRSLLDSGATVAFGSDAPIEGESPWLGLYAAVTRQDAAGQPPGGFLPDERVSLDQAVEAFSRTPARVVAAATELGQLTAGYQADFIVVDRDPWTIPTHELLDVEVLRTVVGGREVHRAAPASGAPAP